MGDANSVVCIPAHLAAEVARTAADREAFEEWVLGQARTGRPLAGLNPASEATMREYEAFRATRAGG
jgi:regulator of RNase E activity RraA